MDAVVVEREADEKRVHAEARTERLDDRDRGAAADDRGRLAPLVFESARGRDEGGRACVETDGL